MKKLLAMVLALVCIVTVFGFIFEDSNNETTMLSDDEIAEMIMIERFGDDYCDYSYTIEQTFDDDLCFNLYDSDGMLVGVSFGCRTAYINQFTS